MTEAVQKPARPPEELSFEEALAELEALTAQMASGTVTLEESVKGYERGAKLLLRCSSRAPARRLNASAPKIPVRPTATRLSDDRPQVNGD